MAAAIRLSQQHSCSFDHLVGASDERGRECKAERRGGLEIECGVEMRRLPHGNVTCFSTSGNLVRECCNISEHIGEVDAIAHKRTCLHQFAKGAYRRCTAFEQQMRDGCAVTQGDRACRNHDWL